MGYWVGGTCWATKTEAVGAVDSMFPSLQASGFMIFADASDANPASGLLNISVRSRMIANAYPTTYNQTFQLSLSTCDALNNITTSRNVAMFQDGVSMGWGVVGAMVAALSVIFIKKAFFR